MLIYRCWTSLSAYGKPRSTDSRERYGRAAAEGEIVEESRKRARPSPPPSRPVKIGTRSAIPRNLSDQSRSGKSSAGRHTHTRSTYVGSRAGKRNDNTSDKPHRHGARVQPQPDPLRKNRKSLSTNEFTLNLYSNFLQCAPIRENFPTYPLVRQPPPFHECLYAISTIDRFIKKKKKERK